MSLTTQLEQLNAAITAIEQGGQEYNIGKRHLKRADIGILYKERKELQRQIADEANSSYGDNVTVARFVGL